MSDSSSFPFLSSDIRLELVLDGTVVIRVYDLFKTQGFNTRSFKRLREGKSSHFALSFVIADRNGSYQISEIRLRKAHAPVNVVVLVVIVYSQTG